MSRVNFEAVLAVLYKMFPTGICAGGYPRDVLTGASPKDIDFWLPQGFDASLVSVFARMVDGTVVNTFDVVQYGMAFDEDRIAAIYQVRCGNGVLVDIIETKFSKSGQVLSTFTDNFSTCVVVPDWLADNRSWIYGWHKVRLCSTPTELVFNEELLAKCAPDRRSARVEKIQRKWNDWVQRGMQKYA